MNKIYDRIYEYYNLLESDEYEVVGVFLFGSQNYGLDSEESDIDAKAIVVPTFDDICENSPATNKHIKFEDGSTLVVKDIRLYCKELKKQGLSTLETLFTKYSYVNHKYRKIWDMLQSIAEPICRYDTVQCVRAFVGTISNQFNFLKNSIEYEDNIRYKSLCSMQFHRQMLYRYIDGESFEDILKLEHLNDLHKTKFDCTLSAQEVMSVAQSILEESIITKEDFIESFDEFGEDHKAEVDFVLDETIKLAIGKSFTLVK